MAPPTLRVRWSSVVFLLVAFVLVTSPLLKVVRAESQVQDDADAEKAGPSSPEGDDAVKEMLEAAERARKREQAEEERKEAKDSRKQGYQPAPGVQTVHTFLKHSGKSPVLHAGQEVDFVAGVYNGGNHALKMVILQGSLHVKYDYRYMVENYSSPIFNSIVPAGSQASFRLTFTPNKLLQPSNFYFTASLLYNVDKTLHASVAHNATIEIIETVGFVSGESVFLGLLASGLLALGGFWAYGQLQKMNSKQKKAKKVVETGTQTSEEEIADNEWLKGTYAGQQKTKSTAQSTRSRKRL